MINLLTKEQCVFIKNVFLLYTRSQTWLFALSQGSQTCFFFALYQGLKLNLLRGPNADL